MTQKEFLERIRKRDLVRANLASPNLLRVIGFNIYLSLSLVGIYGRKWQNLQNKQSILKNLTSEFKIT